MGVNHVGEDGVSYVHVGEDEEPQCGFWMKIMPFFETWLTWLVTALPCRLSVC